MSIMKNRILLILFSSLIICSQTNAQLIRSYGLDVGIVEASQDWNYSGIFEGIDIFNQSRMGLGIVGYIEWFNFPYISVITEVGYNQNGSKDKFEVTTIEFPDGTGEYKTFTPRFDYISIPLMIKLRYEIPFIIIYGFTGPRIDILIGHNKDASGVVDGFKSTETGYNFGIGIEYPIMNRYRVGSEIRYSISNQYACSSQYLTIKNNSIVYLVTFGF